MRKLIIRKLMDRIVSRKHSINTEAFLFGLATIFDNKENYRIIYAMEILKTAS